MLHTGATACALMCLVAAPSLAASLAISPPYAQLLPGQSLNFSASPPGGVIWQVNGVNGSGITAGGTYTAPSTPPVPAVATITAVSVADPAETATAVVSLLAQPLSG